MKKAILNTVISFTIFILIQLVYNIPVVNSQSGGISISPPNIRLNEGQSYKIEISNTTADSFSGTVEPTVFLLGSENSVIPLVEEEIAELELDLDDYLSFDSNIISIGAGESEEVLVTYKKALPGYFLGVTVQANGGEDGNLSIATGIASYIVDFTLTPEEAQNQLKTKVSIQPSSKILGVGIGNVYNIKLTFLNESSRRLVSSGQVYVSILNNQKIKVDQFTITPKLIDGVEPGEEITISNTYTDTRDILSRSGDIELSVELNIEGTHILVTDTIDVSIPVEHFFIVFFIFSIGSSMSFFFYKQKARLNFTKKQKHTPHHF